jgi:hypothetical protein
VAHRLGNRRAGLTLAVWVFVLLYGWRARVCVLATSLELSLVGSALAEPSPTESRDIASETTTALPGAASEEPAASAPAARPATSSVLVPRVTSAPSPAELPPNDVIRTRRPRSEWYGWQTLLSDVATVGFVFTQREESTFFKLGVAAFVAVPPVIHFGHKNYVRGFESLGMRLLLPTGGAFLGLMGGLAGCKGNVSCELVPAAVGGGIGVVTASVLDATVFARKRLPPPSDSAVQWRPLVLVGKNDARIGVGGTF